MMFFIKKKPIVLRCVADRPGIMELAPIQRASKFIPEWFKKLPDRILTEVDNRPWATMKHCTGYVSLYSTGIIMPMWCDLALRIGEKGTTDYRYSFADNNSRINSHDQAQFGGHYDTRLYQHLKIGSPWWFLCEEDIPFMYVEPTWSLMQQANLRVLPGVVGFKYQHTSHVNCFIQRTDHVQDMIIPFLSPLVQIVPLSERPLKLILSDDKDLLRHKQVFSHFTSFLQVYKSNKKAWQRFQEKK